MNKINTISMFFITQLQDRINPSHRVIVISVMGCVLIMAVVFLTCSSGLSQPNQSPPPAKKLSIATVTLGGPALLDTRCSVCHSADIPKRSKKRPDQWEQTVNRMIDKGAELSEDEKKVLLDYLSDSFGKGAVK